LEEALHSVSLTALDGFPDFKAYAAAAEKEGWVELGGKSGWAWISLVPGPR